MAIKKSAAADSGFPQVNPVWSVGTISTRLNPVIVDRRVFIGAERNRVGKQSDCVHKGNRTSPAKLFQSEKGQRILITRSCAI